MRKVIIGFAVAAITLTTIGCSNSSNGAKTQEQINAFAGDPSKIPEQDRKKIEEANKAISQPQSSNAER